MKKKTKLLILSVIASLAFTSAFAACGKKGGNDNGNSSSSTPNSSSEVVDGSSDVGGSGSDSDVVTPATYAFTKVIDPKDFMNGRVTVELAEGAALDLTAPDAVEGKTFKGWVYVDMETGATTPVEAGATMGTAPVVIYADWELTEYTVTITLDGKAYKTLTFAVEGNYDGETPIFGLQELGYNVSAELPKDTDAVTYTVTGIPAAEEGWELQNYTIEVTSNGIAVSEALALGVENGNKVTSGSLKYETRDEAEDEDGNPYYYMYLQEEASYKLADDYFYYEYDDDGDIVKKWYVGYEGGVLALVDWGYEGSTVGKSYDEIVADMVNGYAFETVFDYTTNYYGVEEFVSAIYNLSETKVEAFADDAWSFSLSYVNEQKTKYDVAVSFTLNDKLAMDNVSIEISTFYGQEVQKLDAEGKPIQATDANGNLMTEWDGTPIYETEWVLSESAEADAVSVYTIAQSTDGETVVDYDPAKVLAADYKITDADNEEVDEIDAVAGTEVTLNIADVPETANLAWDTFTVTITDADEVEVESNCIEVYVDTDSNAITVNGYVEGVYTVTIKSTFVTKTLTVSVEIPDTTEIYAKANEYSSSALTSAEIYTDGALNFVVGANEYADASASVVLTKQPEGSETAAVEENDGDYTFTPDVAGEYEITITSEVDLTITSTLTITVKDVPELNTILNGEFQNNDKTKDKALYVKLTFNAGVGNMVVTLDKVMRDWDGNVVSSEKKGAVYAITEYDSATRSLTLMVMPSTNPNVPKLLPEGYTYDETLVTSVTLTADYQVKVVYANDKTTLVAYEELAPVQLVAGGYTYVIDDNNKYSLQVWEDGSASLTKLVWNADYYRWVTESGVEFKFTIDDSCVMDVTEITDGEMAGFSADTTLAYDKATGKITVTLNETEYVFA